MVWFWASFVTGLVLLTLYVSAGRYFSSSISLYRDDVTALLNERLEFNVEIGGIGGSWYWFSPVVVLSDISLGATGDGESAISIDHLEMDMDIWRTLLSGSLQFRQLRVGGVEVSLGQAEQGTWTVLGFSGGNDSELSITLLLESVFNIQRLTLSGVVAEITAWQKPTRSVALDARLYREADFHRVELDISSQKFASRISVVGEGYGDPLDPAVMEGQLYVSLATSSPGELPHLQQWLGLEFLKGELSSEFWINWHGGAGEAVVLVDASEVEFKKRGATQTMGPIDSLSVEFTSAYIDSSWYLQISDGKIQWNNQQANLPKIIAEYEQRQLDVVLHDFSLTDFSKTMSQSKLLSDEDKQLLAKLNPRGILSRAQVSVALEESEWQLQANFEDFALESWKGAPGINNGAGYVSLNSSGGRVDIDAEDFSMYFPTIYKSALSYDAFQTQFDWQISDNGVVVTSGPIHARGQEGVIGGLFSLDLPLGDRVGIDDPEMELMIGLEKSQPKYRSKYLPYTLPRGLLEWLENSIGEGEVKESGFIYRGSLRHGKKDYRTVQLFFDVNDVALKYDSHWPGLSAINGLVLIDDNEVDVISNSARLYSSELKGIRVSVWPESDRGLILTANASMFGSAADGLRLIHESPLKANVGNTFTSWELTGSMQTELDLQISLSNKRSPKVDVSTLWQQVDIDMKPLGLRADAVSGILNYNTNSGFSSKDIAGTIWQQPLAIEVSQASGTSQELRQNSDQKHGGLLVDFETSVEMVSLRKWLDLNLLELATGATSVRGRFSVPQSDSPRLELTTQLQGVALDLPEPYGLSSEKGRTLTVNLPLGGERQRLDLVLEDTLKAYIALNGKQFLGGGVELGLGGAVSERDIAEQIFLVGGHVSYLEWGEWERFIDRYLSEDNQGLSKSEIEVVVENLVIDELLVEGQKFSSINVGMRDELDLLHLTMSSEWLDGAMEIDEQANKWRVDFSRLDVSGLLDNSEIDIGDSASALGDLPEIDIDISQLEIDGESWGNVSMHMESISEGMEVSNIRGQLRNMSIGGESSATLSWYSSKDEYSHFRGDLKFEDFGDVLERWNYQRVVETQNGAATVDLRWPGGPEDFDFRQSFGDLKFETGKGRFLTTGSPSTGTLRVVGILNFAEFLKRLSLDLSHVFKSGIAFEQVDGKLVFTKGKVEIHGFDVQGHSSHFQIEGDVNTVTDTIDAQLVATLPISGNLPWMAALAGGIPAAAGVYVASKVFENQLERVSSATYTVKGSIDDPEVKLERIFDNKAKASSSEAKETDTEKDTEAVNTIEQELKPPTVTRGAEGL